MLRCLPKFPFFVPPLLFPSLLPAFHGAPVGKKVRPVTLREQAPTTELSSQSFQKKRVSFWDDISLVAHCTFTVLP